MKSAPFLLIAFVLLLGCASQPAAPTTAATSEAAVSVSAQPSQPAAITAEQVVEASIAKAAALKNAKIVMQNEEEAVTVKMKYSLELVVGDGEFKNGRTTDLGEAAGIIVFSYYELAAGETICYKNSAGTTSTGFCVPERVARNSPSFAASPSTSVSGLVVSNPLSYAAFLKKLESGGFIEFGQATDKREINGRKCTQITFTGKNLDKIPDGFTQFKDLNAALRMTQSLEETDCFDDKTGVPLEVKAKAAVGAPGASVPVTSTATVTEFKEYIPNRQDLLTPYESVVAVQGTTVVVAASKANAGAYVVAYPEEMRLEKDEEMDFVLAFNEGSVSVSLDDEIEGEGDLGDALKAAMVESGATQATIERNAFTTEAGTWTAVKAKTAQDGEKFSMITLYAEGKNNKVATLNLFSEEAVEAKYYGAIKEMAKSFTILKTEING